MAPPKSWGTPVHDDPVSRDACGASGHPCHDGMDRPGMRPDGPACTRGPRIPGNRRRRLQGDTQCWSHVPTYDQWCMSRRIHCLWKGGGDPLLRLSLIHISEPTRLGMISYAVFCLKKKK